ncbi:MAG: calcium/sodium antiporter [Planctomycetia bacterium]|nr:calcium/sodium antiporter [Planctomycetia bacterium]
MEILFALLAILVGGAIMLGGGEVLVRGASRGALLFGIPPLIIGLTIVAVCTSAPELTVSLMGCFREGGSPEIAVGNIVGSNICNILLILGFAAVIRPITVSVQLIRNEIPFLVLISGLFWIIGWFTVGGSASEHFFPRWGGAVFLVLLVLYMIWAIRTVRKEENKPVADNLCEKKISLPSSPDEPAPAKNIFKESLISLVCIALGLGMLIFGSEWFIDGAIKIATAVGVSKLVISLTVLAVGTSLPELVVSAVAAFKGNTDIAIGNVVGSNIFNLLGILGLTSLLVPGGLALSHQAFVFDIPIMILVAGIGGYLCITDQKLTRIEGILLLLGYAGYVVFLLLHGQTA